MGHFYKMPDFRDQVKHTIRSIQRDLDFLILEIENVPTLKKETEELKEFKKKLTELQIKGLPKTIIRR